MDAVKAEDKKDCEPVCTECVSNKINNTFNLDICLGIGCSSSRWCGLHKGYDQFNCNGCREWLKNICNISSSKLCKQRTKRGSDRYNSDQEELQSISSKGCHSITSKTRPQHLIQSINHVPKRVQTLTTTTRCIMKMNHDQNLNDEIVVMR